MDIRHIVKPGTTNIRSMGDAVELVCRLTGRSGRAVGMHYGGIGGAAVGNIRHKVREGAVDVLPAGERLVSQLRTSNERTSNV